jgi:hypothetical protein
MRVFRHAMVFLLLTLWLAAKEHCNLEAAGWLPDLCATDCGKGTEKDDGCESIEKAQYKNSLEHVKVPPPALLVCLALVPVLEVEPPPALPPDGYEERQTLVRIWQFMERAAPPSRAPAVVA